MHGITPCTVRTHDNQTHLLGPSVCVIAGRLTLWIWTRPSATLRPEDVRTLHTPIQAQNNSTTLLGNSLGNVRYQRWTTKLWHQIRSEGLENQVQRFSRAPCFFLYASQFDTYLILYALIMEELYILYVGPVTNLLTVVLIVAVLKACTHFFAGGVVVASQLASNKDT